MVFDIQEHFLKAIAAGADCVMLGSLIAGTKESQEKRLSTKDVSLNHIVGWVLWKREQGSTRPVFQDMKTISKVVKKVLWTCPV
jgi:hypothetical protein